MLRRGLIRLVILSMLAVLAVRAVADGPDLNVLVGKWQGRVELRQGRAVHSRVEQTRTLIIERIDGQTGSGTYGIEGKEPVQIEVTPSSDGRHVVEFLVPGETGGARVSLRLSSDGKVLRGTRTPKGGGSSVDMVLARADEVIE